MTLYTVNVLLLLRSPPLLHCSHAYILHICSSHFQASLTNMRRWKRKPLKIKKFFDDYTKPGPPYLYWQGDLQSESTLGIDARAEVCKVLAPRVAEEMCLTNRRAHSY